MNFIFNLVFREIRSSWRRLLFFFLCIALGVGSIVALRSLINNLSRAVAGDARGILTADFEVSSTSPFLPTEIAKIEEVIGKSTIVEARNEAVTTSSMARNEENFTFAELKGIESPFPLVGEFLLANNKPFDFNLLTDLGAVVQSTLLTKLNVKIGDTIRIGDADFEIRAAFDEEPGGSSGFKLGPRVFIEKKAFDSAGLLRFGSRARRRILYRTSENPAELIKQLRETLKGSIITVQSYRETQENLGEQFAKTENYLSLTGLLILVLGGIGVWNVARVFVEQKRKTVAILKCLGAGGGSILTIYLLQIMTLGLVGSLFGVFLAQSAMWFVKSRFADGLPANMSYNLQNSAIWQGVVLGLLISLLFSVLPLLQIRNIKPSLLLRDTNNIEIRKLDWTKWTIGLFSLVGLLGLATWQAGSLKIGIAFLVSLAVTSSVLYVSAIFLTRLLKLFKNIGSFSVSQAVNSLYRPGNQTRVILLAVGLGAFVVLAVQSLQTNLIREFDLSRNQTLPSLFVFDILKSQVNEVKSLAETATGEEIKPIPNVRMRMTELDGKPIDFQQKEMREERGRLGREYIVTYRSQLEDNEQLIEGKWFGETTEPEVSMADDMRDLMSLDLGSVITFDVLGRRISAKVTSIRKFDTKKTRTAFMFVFPPGVLEKAPQTFTIPMTTKLDAKSRADFQRSVLDKFANVQIFDVADIVNAVGKLINNFVLAISFVGSFVILTGILILIGSVALTKSQRIYENAILKTLGAKRPTLAVILLVEYGLLGLLAGIIGTIFSTAMSYGVTKFIFEIDWSFDVSLFFIGICTTTLLVMIVGTIASFDVLFRKPLATLRNQ
jgi:putative ABC transport system permease protein